MVIASYGTAMMIVGVIATVMAVTELDYVTDATPGWVRPVGLAGIAMFFGGALALVGGFTPPGPGSALSVASTVGLTIWTANVCLGKGRGMAAWVELAGYFGLVGAVGVVVTLV